jgi:hypothetical protein
MKSLRRILLKAGIFIAIVVVGLGAIVGTIALAGSGPPPKRFDRPGPITRFDDADWQYVLTKASARLIQTRLQSATYCGFATTGANFCAAVSLPWRDPAVFAGSVPASF